MTDMTTDPRVEIPTGEALMDLTKVVVELAKSSQVFSDIMIHEDEPIMAKFPRGLEAFPGEPVDRKSMINFIAKFEPKWQEKILGKEGCFDFVREISEMRLRFNVYLCGTKHRLAIALRRIPKQVPTFTSIGLPEGLASFANRGKGLIIITGGTGAGKTTTQAAFLNHINETRPGHILTIEDPIEYVHQRKEALFSQREVPTHVDSFAAGLRSALRQKPDVIVVGEVRDKETADALFLAAESGHLVFATLHANSAANAVDKLLSFYSESGESTNKAKALSSVLVGVISQSLLPNVAGDNYEVVYEILEKNSMIATAISELKKPAVICDLMKTQVQTGNTLTVLLNEMMSKKIKEGKISLKDAQYVAYDLEDLSRRTNSGR